MKIVNQTRSLLTGLLLVSVLALHAQKASVSTQPTTLNEPVMKTYLIERELPGAGKLTAEELKNISKTSCTVLKEMGTSIQWMQSYVVGNKIYCVYRAENEELIKQHAKKGGFPCNSITEIVNVISPATATGG